MKVKLCCILFFLFQITESIGQADSSATKNHFVWMNLSPQFISSSNLNILPTPSIGFNYSFKHIHNIRIKYYQTEKHTFDTTNANTDEPLQNRLTALQSFSIQYGIGKFLNKKIIGSFYCGLSFNNGIYRGEITRTVYNSGSSWLFHTGPSTSYYYDYHFFKNVKVPLAINFMIPIGPPFAIGFEIFANIGKYPDYGFALNLSLGHVANKRAKAKKVKHN